MGAEIRGLDLSAPLSGDLVTLLLQAYSQYQLLLFKDQQITSDQFIAFSKLFGELRMHPNPTFVKFCLPDQPSVLILSNIVENGNPIGLAGAADRWHSEGSYNEYPGKATLLHSIEVPEQGGDTLFADQYTAYNDLTADIKHTIASLYAWHSYVQDYERMRDQNPNRPKLTGDSLAQVQPCLHPIVIAHPITNKKCLYINETYTTHIEGMPAAESKDLLKYLLNHSTQLKYQYCHKWQSRDIVLWDNCSLLHRATDTLPQYRRRLNRTTIKGVSLTQAL